MEQFVNKLKSRLKEALPGQDAQYLMAPVHRERLRMEEVKKGSYRPSAVMVLFCRDHNGEWFIPLTERMSYKGAHSGQISLPGGKPDPEDENLEQTALRECYEEIGIRNIEVLGQLTELYIPVSGFLVQPFVGIYPEVDPVMSIQEREVRSILKLRVSDLLNHSIIEQGTIELQPSLRISTPWFNVNNHRVWGATAMILSELKEVIKEVW